MSGSNSVFWDSKSNNHGYINWDFIIKCVEIDVVTIENRNYIIMTDAPLHTENAKQTFFEYTSAYTALNHFARLMRELEYLHVNLKKC